MKIMELTVKEYEKLMEKQTNNEEDKDIPPIPELELFTIEHNMKGCTKEDQINFNFRTLKEKINQVVEELNKRQ